MCRMVILLEKPHHRGHQPRHGCQSGREEPEPRGHQREGAKLMGQLWKIDKHGYVACLKMLCTPLKPMVLLIIIPFLNGYFIGNIPNIFRQTHVRNYQRIQMVA